MLVTQSVVLITGTILNIITQYDYSLAASISICLATLTYHGLTQREDKVDGVRDAMACSFVVAYLTLVTYATFWPTPGPGEGQPYPQTTTLLNSFTTLVGVVAAFYFPVIRSLASGVHDRV